MRADLQRLLHSQDLDTVKPSAFKQVGGAVFPDGQALSDLAVFVSIVDAYRATHAPAYGSPIPATSAASAALTGSGDLLTLTGSSVAYINAVSVTNGSGSDAVAVSITLNGVQVSVAVDIPPTETMPITLNVPLYVDSNAPLKVVASGAGTATTTAAYILTSQ